MGARGLGREVDENVAVDDFFLAESLQSLLPELLGLLTPGWCWCAAYTSTLDWGLGSGALHKENREERTPSW